MSLRPLIVNALSKHTATVIMLHGLGDSGAGWVSLAENWRRRNKFDEVKFIFPNAPSIPITINGGFVMPGWYDITSFSDLNAVHDEPGIIKSRNYLTGLVDAEINEHKIPSEKIIIGGFSQGGAVSLFTGLTIKQKLAGIFGLSCYLVLHDKVPDFVKEANKINQETPFFIGHGDADQVVQYPWGVETARIIEKDLGHKVEFKTYPGLPHSAAMEEVDDLEKWITKCLDAKPVGQGEASS
ncbi:hypothetical protein OHC33_004970 [Knufia fluminis]|uniref:Acyl-protein thioesterase 1 n=1 Tax=Knufia fluminis TaxID=191047 RepID=A0AAN8EU22_9EURO|nr:hypothetical protein OHC33_004970 [Knufia fluminis]